MDYSSEGIRKAKEEATKIRKIPNSDMALIRDQIAKLGSSPAPSQVEDILFSKAKELGVKDADLFNQLYQRDKSLLPNGKQASMAEKYKAAENASIERGAKGLEKNLVSPTAEKYKAVLTEGEKKMARSILSGNIGKAGAAELSTLEKFIRPAGSAIAGLVEAIPPLNKYAEKNPTARVEEMALSPEGSKGIARGVGAMAGLEAGASLGAMSPVLKGPTALAGAVGGSIAGAKLGELLTGIPAVDKLIRAAYEKQLREREARIVKDAKSSEE